MFKLASWNVNSLKIRLEQVLAWFECSQIDILALQETKLMDDHFPVTAFSEKGYHVVYIGQKAYNGVAIISREPMTEIITDVPLAKDTERRMIAATVGNVRIVNLYVPNGMQVGSDKYEYKLLWLEKIYFFIREQLERYSQLAVMGDFNVAPEDRDVHSPAEWEGCVLVSPLERQAFAQLLSLGLTDSFRLFPQEDKLFSWWDYRAGGFRRNRGLRIDHILLSKALCERCVTSQIDKTPRQAERPSDHTPVWAEFI